MSSDQYTPNTVAEKPAEEKQEPNRAARRFLTRNKSKPVQQYGCGTCRRPFIGKDRCQCKPVVKARQMAEVV